jgi:hypothetical protein
VEGASELAEFAADEYKRRAIARALEVRGTAHMSRVELAKAVAALVQTLKEYRAASL